MGFTQPLTEMSTIHEIDPKRGMKLHSEIYRHTQFLNKKEWLQLQSVIYLFIKGLFVSHIQHFIIFKIQACNLSCFSVV
jgi:hypothetical protein